MGGAPGVLRSSASYAGECVGLPFPGSGAAIRVISGCLTNGGRPAGGYVVLHERLRAREETVVYAVVRQYEGVTDPAEAGRRVAEGFVPLLRRVPGFVAYYWIDAGGGVMVSTSVFEDRSGAEESTGAAADFVRDNLASLLPSPPRVTAGEVVAAG